MNHLQLDSPRLAHRRLDKNKNPSDTIHSVSSPKILISRLTLTKNEEFQQIQPMDINCAEIEGNRRKTWISKRTLLGTQM